MRSLVSVLMETVGSPFRTRDAMDVPTPAVRATSASRAARPLRLASAMSARAPALAEQVLGETDPVELVRRRLGVTMPVPQGDHVVPREERVPLELGELVAGRRVLLDVRVLDVLEDDRATPEDAVGREHVRAVPADHADAVVAHAVTRRRDKLELEVADRD